MKKDLMAAKVAAGANEEYQERVAETEELLKKLQMLIEKDKKNQAKDPKSWGYAVDMLHVQDGLTELVRFLRRAT